MVYYRKHQMQCASPHTVIKLPAHESMQTSVSDDMIENIKIAPVQDEYILVKLRESDSIFWK